MPTRLLLFLFAVILMIHIACSDEKNKSPVLVLATEQEFGNYTAEILKTEGFRNFELDSLESGRIKASRLKHTNILVLAESQLNPRDQHIIKKYVEKGGNLIAVCPQPELNGLFGLTPAEGVITEGYLSVDANSVTACGISSQAMRIHGSAAKYIANGCQIIAELSPDREIKEVYPAVVSAEYGRGRAIAFLYNLPMNIVYTRQGNPEFAGVEKDGIPGIRAMDLFTDGWVDTANNTINQADQQMALFSKCIESLSVYSHPLPRLWYFPDTLKCLVTLTNDGEFKGEDDFETQFRDIDSLDARMTLYVLQADKVSRQWTDNWTAKGFEIAGHPDDIREAENPTWANMNRALQIKKTEIASRYGLPMRTVVNHWFVWCGNLSDGTPDFAAQAKLENIHGIEMDINYAHYDINSNQGENYLGSPGINQGNYTGSGMVMKFADADGRIIPVYQHFNSVYDQQYTERNDPEGFFNCFKGLMDRSLYDDIPSFISVKSHNDEYWFTKAPLLKMLSYAREKNIPVWTELHLLEFLKMRDEAVYKDLKWSDGHLKFTIVSAMASHPSDLSLFLPLRHNDKEVESITINGSNSEWSIMPFKGSDYARFTVTPGDTYFVHVDYK